MPASSTDYSQQLHTAVQTSRYELLAKKVATEADTATAFGAYNVSRRTFEDARRAMYHALSRLAVIAYIDRKVVDANFTADLNLKLAQEADAKAVAATQAVSLATASIRNAVAAVESLSYEVNGMAGNSPREEKKRLAIDAAAQDAAADVEAVLKSVLELKTQALDANVEAASPRTGGTVQAATVARTRTAALLDIADKTLEKEGTEALARAHDARADSLQDMFAKSVEFQIAARQNEAICEAAAYVDVIANAGLRATPVAENGAPRIEAACDSVRTKGKEAETVVFFAVPAAAAAAFDIQAASDALEHGIVAKPEKRAGPKKNGRPDTEFRATLAKDSTGNPLEHQHSYVVFSLRNLDRSAARNAHDLSFPTPPITCRPQLQLDAPVILPVLHRAFVVLFQGPPRDLRIEAYQVCLVPAENLEDDDNAPSERSSSKLLMGGKYHGAASSPVHPFDICTRRKLIDDLVRAQFLSDTDVRQLADEDHKALETNLSRIETEAVNLREKDRKPLYVVYFNPVTRTHVEKDTAAQAGAGETRSAARKKITKDALPDSPAAEQDEGATQEQYTLGRWSDINGDLLDLANRAYRALVVATPAGSDPAHDVISPPSLRLEPLAKSELFPVRITSAI